MMGGKQGDSGQRSEPVRLINQFVVDHFYNYFY